jgi:hypothetical protein
MNSLITQIGSCKYFNESIYSTHFLIRFILNETPAFKDNRTSFVWLCNQGDQIKQIFALWAPFLWVYYFQNCTSGQNNFLPLFFTETVTWQFRQNMGWATFWATFFHKIIWSPWLQYCRSWKQLILCAFFALSICSLFFTTAPFCGQSRSTLRTYVQWSRITYVCRWTYVYKQRKKTMQNIFLDRSLMKTNFCKVCIYFTHAVKYWFTQTNSSSLLLLLLLLLTTIQRQKCINNYIHY